jgi:uncharacterized protein (TIGR04255 family)
MEFELAKPPIIEGWISATFDAAEDGPEWDWTKVVSFLEGFSGELPIRERLQVPEPIVDDLDDNVAPREIQLRVVPKYFRARTESRSRVIQVGERELLVSQLRDESGHYPGFSQLLALFMEVLPEFRRQIGLGCVRRLELHYVDNIQIPMESDSVDIRDFFEGAPELPLVPFGGTSRTDWSMTFVTPDCGDIADFAAKLRPFRGEYLEFRLDWHRNCSNFPDDPESIATRLKMAHTYLKDCFRQVCKNSVWTLFEPR